MGVRCQLKQEDIFLRVGVALIDAFRYYNIRQSVNPLLLKIPVLLKMYVC